MNLQKNSCQLKYITTVFTTILLAVGTQVGYGQDAKNLSFDDFKFKMKKGEDFEKSMLTEDIKQYVGKKIKIRGYIRPSFRQKDLKQFILVRDNMECCFGPGAMLYDCMIVRMEKGKTTDFTVRPIAVEGEFRIRQFNGPKGKPWAIYEIRGLSVK